MMSDGIHYMGFITRRQGLSHAEFSHHWGTVHRDLVMEFARPGPIERYVQDVGCEQLPEGFVNHFDGSPELWLADQQALETLFSAERFQYAYHIDSPLFITMPATSFFVQDSVILDGDSTGFKLMRLIPRPEDERGLQGLINAWGEPHPIGFTQQPSRLVRSQIIGAEAEGTDADHYHGIECSWWPDARVAASQWLSRDVSLSGDERVLLCQERIVLERL